MLVNPKRRLLLKVASLTAASYSQTSCVITPSRTPAGGAQADPIQIELFREEDLFTGQLEAWGFFLDRAADEWCLKPRRDSSDRYLIFTLPPQHYAESTIPLTGPLPEVESETNLERLRLISGKPARLVFKVPAAVDYIGLSLAELLRWDRFEYQKPDLDRLADPITGTRRHFIGIDWFKPLSSEHRQSVIDLPWGVFLQPLGMHGVDFRWKHSITPITRNGRTELWTSSLVSTTDAAVAPTFEVLDVRGLHYNGTDASPSSYTDDSFYKGRVKETVECSPTANWDRLELAASLSRRFPYTGDPFSGKDTDQLVYDGAPTGACWTENNRVSATTYTLSPLGGFLTLDSKWDAKAGCALTAWQHTATYGRDHFVRFTRKGFLYPFGTPAELVILSEREFVRDEKGHFVAPLYKQAFIQVPQPNEVSLGHPETPFAQLSVTTAKSPPLDLPASGNLVEYAMCDYFLPMVGGKPFEFTHIGTDHEQRPVESRMAMFFVSNKARKSNGLIHEPSDAIDSASAPAEKKRSTPSCTPAGTGNPASLCRVIARSSPSDEGIRSVDKDWQVLPHRFAGYAGVRIGLAPPTKPGNTTHEVEWIEWVRGQQPKLERGIAAMPFKPRARTIKLVVSVVSQLSSQRNAILATYRDVRSVDRVAMDPLPTLPDAEYFSNVLDPRAPQNVLGAYLYALPLAAIRESPVWHPFPAEANSKEARVRSVYYGVSTTPGGHPIPASLFRGLSNTSSFGINSTSESTGGLSTPDSPVGLLTRENGAMGDAVTDAARWAEAAPQRKFAIPAERADFISYRLLNRCAGSNALTEPFDKQVGGSYPRATSLATINAAVADPRVTPPAIMSGSHALSSPSALTGVTDVSSLFGVDAEILPGIRLSKVFEGVPLDVSPVDDADSNLFIRDPKSSRAPKWDLKVTGLDEILVLFGNLPGQITPEIALRQYLSAPIIEEPGDALDFGTEASLVWETNEIRGVDLGIVKFKPRDSAFSINASMQISARSPRPTVQASASLTNFSLLVLDSLDVAFTRVSFTMAPDGTKTFSPLIEKVSFAGALSFVSNLQQLLKDLLRDYGISIDVTPQWVDVSQKIMIPPAAEGKEGGTFYLGPATITNLNLNWGVRIPIVGRDVVTIRFGLATRDDPLIIFVPPWYGGKAHVLIESTTTSIRLFEASIEFGALIFAEYSIARGEVSFMAGIFLAIAKVSGGQTFSLSAFVKVTGRLSVASIIEFCGLIHVSLDYEQSSGDAPGSKLAGQATVTVSTKIGFFRVSYSFTARHEERRAASNSSSQAHLPVLAMDLSVTPRAIAAQDSKASAGSSDRLDHRYPFRNREVLRQWEEFVSGFAE